MSIGRTGSTALATAAGVRRERGDKYMLGRVVRIKFPQRPEMFRFQINPSNVEIEVPPRISVTQTLGSSYVDALGKGLPTVSLAGSCGWGVPLDDPQHGKTGLQQFLELKQLIEQWVNETVKQTTPATAACDLFIDFLQQMYQIVWNPVKFSQTKPFTIDYTLSGTVIFDYNSPIVVLPLGQLDQAALPRDGGTPPFLGDGAS